MEIKMEKKVCNKCNKEKSLTEYHKNKSAKDGFRSDCKECHCAIVKKYYQENPEKARARHKKYYQEHREQKKANSKKYRKENPEKVKAIKRKYIEENPEKVRESKRLSQSKRRARKLNTQVEVITDELLNEHWIKKGIDPQRCYHCKEGLYEHLDHYYPLSKGGTHTKENLVPSCEYCNLSKKDKTPEEWKEYQASQ